MISDSELATDRRQYDARGQLTSLESGRTLAAQQFSSAMIVTPDDLRMITDAVPALISFFDAEHVCRFANEHHAQWYGREPDELVGLHMRSFLGDAAYESRLAHLDRVATGEKVSFDAKVPHRDGSWRDAAIRYVPKMGAKGFEGLYILVFDVAIQQHRFHSIFDGTAVGFWVVDFAGLATVLKQFCTENTEELLERLASDPGLAKRALDATPVLELNAKAREMFGISAEEARGQSLGRWCSDASLPALTANFVAYLSGAASFETETVMTTSAGQSIDVLLTCAFPKTAPGETAVVIGTTDISRRVAREKQLARAQADLAHAARVATLGELMASIAHEVNQPLAAVVTNGNAALRWLNRAQPDTVEAHNAIARMVSEGTRASEIITRTRAMAVKGESERTSFGVNAMIEDTVAIVHRQVAALGAELALELETGLPDVTADRIQLQQVAINLIINAAQAMADHSADRRDIVIRSSRHDNTITVEVTDNGPGLDPADLARIFEAFYSTKESGMGMGLSVTKSIVESHGGTIRAKICDHGGASFAFTVPLPETTDAMP